MIQSLEDIPLESKSDGEAVDWVYQLKNVSLEWASLTTEETGLDCCGN